MDTVVTTDWPELPEDVRVAISDINANINVLLAYLTGTSYGMNEDNAKYHAFKISEICQDLMSEKS